MYGIKDCEFEKCGEVIVAPQHNVFALACCLCHDVFMKFDEFQKHIVKQHDVYLGIYDTECPSDEEEKEQLVKNSVDGTLSAVNGEHDKMEAEKSEDIDAQGEIKKGDDEEDKKLSEIIDKDPKEIPATSEQEINETTAKICTTPKEDCQNKEDSNKVKNPYFAEENDQQQKDNLTDNKQTESSKTVDKVESMDVDECLDTPDDECIQKLDLESREDNLDENQKPVIESQITVNGSYSNNGKDIVTENNEVMEDELIPKNSTIRPNVEVSKKEKEYNVHFNGAENCEEQNMELQNDTGCSTTEPIESEKMQTDTVENELETIDRVEAGVESVSKEAESDAEEVQDSTPEQIEDEKIEAHKVQNELQTLVLVVAAVESVSKEAKSDAEEVQESTPEQIENEKIEADKVENELQTLDRMEVFVDNALNETKNDTKKVESSTVEKIEGENMEVCQVELETSDPLEKASNDRNNAEQEKDSEIGEELQTPDRMEASVDNPSNETKNDAKKVQDSVAEQTESEKMEMDQAGNELQTSDSLENSSNEAINAAAKVEDSIAEQIESEKMEMNQSGNEPKASESLENDNVNDAKKLEDSITEQTESKKMEMDEVGIELQTSDSLEKSSNETTNDAEKVEDFVSKKKNPTVENGAVKDLDVASDEELQEETCEIFDFILSSNNDVEISSQTTGSDVHNPLSNQTDKDDSTVEKVNNNENPSERTPESSTEHKENALNMEIDEDLTTHTPVIISNVSNDSEEHLAASSKERDEKGETPEKITLIDLTAEILDNEISECIKPYVTETEHENQRPDYSKGKTKESVALILDNVSEAPKDNIGTECETPNQSENDNESLIVRDSKEEMVEPEKPIDEMETEGETKECNNSVGQLQTSKNDSAEESKQRRKSVKLAEIFDDLDLDLDEDDEDMKIFENLILREDSNCSSADEENEVGNNEGKENKSVDKNAVETEEKTEQKMCNKDEVTETKSNESSKNDLVEESSKEESPNVVSEPSVDNKIIDAKKSIKEALQTESILSDEYTDSMPIAMEEDTEIISKHDTQDCTDNKNIRNGQTLEKAEAKDNFIKQETPQKLNEKKFNSPKETSLKKTSEKIEIQSNEVIVKANSVNESIPSIKYENKSPNLQKQNQFKATHVKTPQSQLKKIPIIDTPRPIHIINRSILNKKRKLSEDDVEGPSPKNCLPLRELNRHNSSKMPKLDIPTSQTILNQSTDKLNEPTTEKIDNQQNIGVKSPKSAHQEKEGVPLFKTISKSKNYNLPKSLTIRRLSIAEEQKTLANKTPINDKVQINRFQKQSNISSPSISSSIRNRNLNPVVRIKRFKLLKAETDSKPLKVQLTPKIMAGISPQNSLKSKIQSQQPKDKLDDDDVIGDLFHQVSKENVKESETNETQETVTEIQHFNDEYDAHLLSQLGLNIISDPQFELNSSPSKVRACRILAQKFSNLLVESNLIYKAPEKEHFNETFYELLDLVNDLLPEDKNLQIHDLKRLIFLVMRWYTALDDAKHPISQSQSLYVEFFKFLPKTVRRVHYCEYCQMTFHSQTKWEAHRVSHTDSNSMVCVHCAKVFKRKKAFEIHEEKCKLKVL